MRRFPTYPKYKDSGVEWLGEVPEEWKLNRLGWHIDLLTGYPFKSELFDFDDGIRLVRGDNVTEGRLRWGDKTRFWVDLQDELKKYLLIPNDLLIGMDGSKVGKNYALVTSEDLPLLLVQRVARLRSKNNLIIQFLSYLIGSNLFLVWVELSKTDPAIPHISSKDIQNFPIGVPPLPEQTAIAAFLDRETALIDALIEKKERLIALLEEKRAALISQAVTKGLDPTVPMKDSGVEWIGMVPEHWKIVQLKHLFTNLDSKRIPLSSEERAEKEKIYPYYGASGVIDKVDNYIFDEPLLLVAEDGANLYSRSSPLAFIAKGRYWVNNHAHILKPKSGSLSFWEGLLLTYDYTPMITGSAQPKLTAENLERILLPFPPPIEQTAISKFLDYEIACIDDIISKIHSSINFLTEYRTSLISSAVTGKIDVRQEVII